VHFRPEPPGPEHELDLRRAEDRARLFGFLTAHDLALKPAAVEFSASKLNEDWLVGQWPPVIDLWSSISGNLRIPLATWIETIASTYEMRQAAGIEEQIRRLGIRSHEHLDTELVIRIASKYHCAGYEVSFEPNGQGCSDLSIRGRGSHLYCEVKRENRQEHKRYKSVWRASQAVLNAARGIVGWLEERDLRMEIWFSRSFADNVAKAVVQEIMTRIHSLEASHEQDLKAVPGSRCIILPRFDPEFYHPAIRAAQLEIKQTGVPMQLAAHNMPIVVAFDGRPNLQALMQRVRKAAKQLKNDSFKDPNAQGFIVVETSHGELARDAIAENFENLPPNCIAAIVRSDVSTVVARENVSTEILETLKIAGAP
jgi:hypothetical protein